MGLITNEKIALIEASGGLMVETYASRLGAILELMNSGSIGDGIYGSEAHLIALCKIEARLAEVVGKINEHNNPRKSDCDEDEDNIQMSIEVIRSERRASVSLLQRRLRLGYARAALIMDELERRGVVGPAGGNGEPREVLFWSPNDKAETSATRDGQQPKTL